jgi:hypothetical protein
MDTHMDMHMDVDSSNGALGPVCRLTGAHRTARLAAVGAFVAQANGVAAIPGGVRITFPRTADVARSIVDFVKTERDCCGGVRFDVARQGAERTFDLDIVGDADDAPRLQAFYLGLARPASAAVADGG